MKRKKKGIIRWNRINKKKTKKQLNELLEKNEYEKWNKRWKFNGINMLIVTEILYFLFTQLDDLDNIDMKRNKICAILIISIHRYNYFKNNISINIILLNENI